LPRVRDTAPSSAYLSVKYFSDFYISHRKEIWAGTELPASKLSSAYKVANLVESDTGQFAGFSTVLNDIWSVGLNAQPSLSGNIGYSKASLTSFPALRVLPAH
jgi:hypothetical protein